MSLWLWLVEVVWMEMETKLLISCTPALLTTFAPAPAPASAAASAHDDADLADTPKIPHAHPLSRNSSAAYIPRAGDYGDVQVTLNTKETNNFCTSWANQLRHGSSDPFRLRTLLEDLKLKVIQVWQLFLLSSPPTIFHFTPLLPLPSLHPSLLPLPSKVDTKANVKQQELNFIRKVIDLAKLSNYQLYKSYVVLRANSNCDVLLNLLMKDITNDATTTEVLEVIYERIFHEFLLLLLLLFMLLSSIFISTSPTSSFYFLFFGTFVFISCYFLILQDMQEELTSMVIS